MRLLAAIVAVLAVFAIIFAIIYSAPIGAKLLPDVPSTEK